jgi:hypothetical protein
MRRVSVKKLLGIVAVAAGLSLGSADQAKAAGPFYIYFADYCDCIQLTRASLAGHNWFFGTWDWECTGNVSNTLIHGVIHDGEAALGAQPIDSNGNPAGFSVTMALESAQLGSDHAHITATFDGVTNTLVAEEADYFLRKQPACPGPPNTKPRMFP